MYKFILAFRYLLKRRISCLALVAVALCVFTVVVVMSVMNGLVSDFKEKNHKFTGDCVISTNSLVGFAYYQQFTKILEQTDIVNAVSPVVTNYALMNVPGSDRSFGVSVYGVDPNAHTRVTTFEQDLHYAKKSADMFKSSYAPLRPGCILGVDMWLTRGPRGNYDFSQYLPRQKFNLNCLPLTPTGALARAGTSIVNSKTFYLSDIANTGLARVDSSAVFISLDQAQLLCGMSDPPKRVNALHLKFTPSVTVKEGTQKVATLWENFTKRMSNQPYAYLFDNVDVRTWKQHRRQYIAAMEKEQVMLTAMFILLGLTAVFVVLVVLYMIVCHKSKDIGILKSIGVSPAGILQVFTLFAIIQALIGSAVGLIFGLLFLYKVNGIEQWLYNNFGFQLWNRAIYAIDKIPVNLSPVAITVIVLAALAACILGALIPGMQAARLDPAEALRTDQL